MKWERPRSARRWRVAMFLVVLVGCVTIVAGVYTRARVTTLQERLHQNVIGLSGVTRLRSLVRLRAPRERYVLLGSLPLPDPLAADWEAVLATLTSTNPKSAGFDEAARAFHETADRAVAATRRENRSISLALHAAWNTLTIITWASFSFACIVVAGAFFVLRSMQRRARAASEHADRLYTLGESAGGIAHDFSNLATTITGSGRLALDRLEPDSAARAWLVQLVSTADAARVLGRQISAYATGRSEEPAIVNLSNLVHEMARLLQILVRTNARLLIQSDGAWLPILNYEVALRQVIVNVVKNAAEACAAAGGTVNVSVRQISASDIAQEDWMLAPDQACEHYVCLEVVDDGEGMPARVRECLLDPYFSTKHGGHGLGLQTVSRIVDQSHGGIAIDSLPGEGTRFRVYFPRASAPNPETAVS